MVKCLLAVLHGIEEHSSIIHNVIIKEKGKNIEKKVNKIERNGSQNENQDQIVSSWNLLIMLFLE